MSVTGSWHLTLNSPLGDQSALLEIQETDGSMQGTLTGKAEPAPLERLEIEDTKLKFSANADTPVGRLNLAFDGAIEGDSMSGTYSTPFGAFNFSGTRA